MAKRMLIDANHPEETRVVVLSGKRIEEFDYETAARSQLKGNIYLAKITRVEPSLQAAFVEYGGNRHGFLPFSEIHPDYYRIPIADREALAAEEAALRGDVADEVDGDEAENDAPDHGEALVDSNGDPDGDTDSDRSADSPEADAATDAGVENGESQADPNGSGPAGPGLAKNGNQNHEVEQVDVEARVDTVGGDEIDDQRRRRANLLRRYKIQEVIKRRQVILVQVAKEERGTKGAALTTYLSLAGRYCVLMPNTARGGGISRKIGSANDRRRLKGILGELEIPDGMAVIVRTAGSQRSKAEIRRDYEYLMRLWDDIRKTTLQSTAPCLIHEEANLIKRSIRDLYSRDMDDVWVQGENGYKTAKAFMRSLMPSHAKKVQQYKDQSTPIFLHYQVEGQLEAMHSPTVQLKSGGYVVLNQTEALVAIDVNSGRATRERHIEETALKTNLEAAEEVARQLRLRDLAGLVVVDFIDMEEPRHNRDVERKLKEAMRSDRARIQLGRVSPFGLLEMSRQRLRPSLFESSTVACPRCGGSGHVRSVHSSALAVLRALEEEGLRGREGEVRVTVPTAVALYFLNEFRNRLIQVEESYGFRVAVEADDSLLSDDYRMDRSASAGSPAADGEADEEETGRKRRRGRRRRKGGEDEGTAEEARTAEPEPASEESEAEEARDAAGEGSDGDEGKKGRRRRGRRGGRRRARRRPDGQEAQEAQGGQSDANGAEASDGPTEAVESTGTAKGAEAEATGPAPENGAEAPRPKRSRRPRKKPAAAASEDAEAAPADTDGGPSAAADDAPAKPAKRTRRAPADRQRRSRSGSARTQSRPSADDDAAAAPQPDIGDNGPDVRPDPEPTMDAPQPAPQPAPQSALGPEETGDGSTRSDGGGERPAAAAAPEPGEPGDGDDLPKRRGWWQRWV